MTARPTALDVPAADTAAAVSLYDHPLPAFVEEELERLYKNVFSSVVRVDSQGLLAQTSAFVSRQGGVVTTVLLFRRDGSRVRVLNEAIALTEAEVGLFARTVFAAYPAVKLVAFPAVRTTIAQLPLPRQQFDCLEDIVLDLPATTEAYFGALGKNMRTSLKRYQKKVAADFPGFKCTFYAGKDVSERQLAELVKLSSARIASKNQASSHNDDKTAQLVRLVRARGLVLLATIDERICGGVICTEFGGNFFMHVIAHDPSLDEYRLGKACCYLSICEAIARGAREYHFLWGRYEYKYRLLGTQRDFDRLVLYRSRLAVLQSLGTWLATAWRGHGRRVKQWLLADERKDDMVTQWLLGASRMFARKA